MFIKFADDGVFKVYCKIVKLKKLSYIILWLMSRKSFDLSFVSWLQTHIPVYSSRVTFKCLVI